MRPMASSISWERTTTRRATSKSQLRATRAQRGTLPTAPSSPTALETVCAVTDAPLPCVPRTKSLRCDDNTSPLPQGGYETGPTPTLVAQGRYWRAMEHFPPPYRWPVDYQAAVVSAPIGSDLLDPASWTVSLPLPFDEEWIPKNWTTKPSAPGILKNTHPSVLSFSDTSHSRSSPPAQIPHHSRSSPPALRLS